MIWSVPDLTITDNNEREIAVLYHVNNKKMHGDVMSKLPNLLQISLETDKILELFFKHIKPYFKLTKFLYLNEQHDTSIILGNKMSLQINNHYVKKFQLYYQAEYLGEIHCASKYKFTNPNITELKSCINLLILPLRNSLLYKIAIKATVTDPLTQLGNKLSLIQDLQYHFNLASRYNSALSLIFLDIDYFKSINDRYGHIIGDKILVQLSTLLKLAIRKSDKIYRFGGEEFVLILGQTNQTGAVNLAQKLQNFLVKNKIFLTINTVSTEFNITVSMGIAVKNSNDTPDSLTNRADEALYCAKNNGRNQFICK